MENRDGRKRTTAAGRRTVSIKILMFGVAVYANVGIQAYRLARPVGSCISYSHGARTDRRMAVSKRAAAAEVSPPSPVWDAPVALEKGARA